MAEFLPFKELEATEEYQAVPDEKKPIANLRWMILQDSVGREKHGKDWPQGNLINKFVESGFAGPNLIQFPSQAETDEERAFESALFQRIGRPSIKRIAGKAVAEVFAPAPSLPAAERPRPPTGRSVFAFRPSATEQDIERQISFPASDISIAQQQQDIDKLSRGLGLFSPESTETLKALGAPPIVTGELFIAPGEGVPMRELIPEPNPAIRSIIQSTETENKEATEGNIDQELIAFLAKASARQDEDFAKREESKEKRGLPSLDKLGRTKFDVGTRTVNLGLLSYAQMMNGSFNVEQFKKIERELAELRESVDFDIESPSTLLLAMAGGSTELSPMILRALEEGAIGGTAGLVVGAAVGAVAGGGVGAVPTAPAMAAFGAATASTMFIYRLETGLSYGGLRARGVSHRVAREIAPIVGAANAALEIAQAGIVLRIGKQAVNKLTSSLRKRIIGDAAESAAIRNFGISLGEVTMEGAAAAGGAVGIEFFQEQNQIVGDLVGAAIEVEALENSDVDPVTFDEWAARSREALKQAALAIPLFTLPGTSAQLVGVTIEEGRARVVERPLREQLPEVALPVASTEGLTRNDIKQLAIDEGVWTELTKNEKLFGPKKLGPLVEEKVRAKRATEADILTELPPEQAEELRLSMEVLVLPPEQIEPGTTAQENNVAPIARADASRMPDPTSEMTARRLRGATVKARELPNMKDIRGAEDPEALQALLDQFPTADEVQDNPSVTSILKRKKALEDKLSETQDGVRVKEEVDSEALIMAESSAVGESTPTEESEVGNFPIDPRVTIQLMEAARLLKATVKSVKELAEEGILGAFISIPVTKAREIQVQSVRWTRTIAHEVGHAINYVLNGENAFISEKLYPALKDVPSETVITELRAVSETYRPLPGGLTWSDVLSEYIDYRSRKTELYADFAGLYMLNNDMARQIAPTLSSAMDEMLQNNPKVADTIRSVIDIPEIAPTPVARAEQATELTVRQRTPIRDFFNPVAVDPALKQRGYDLVAEAMRGRKVEIERIKQQVIKWRKNLTRKQRDDVSLLIEEIGDPRIEGDTFQDVQERSTPQMTEAAKEVRFVLEEMREDVNKILQDVGEGPDRVAFLENYLPHFYEGSPAKMRQFAADWDKRLRSAQKRKFLTYKDAIDAGLTPISFDVAFLVEASAEANFKAAFTRSILGTLKNMKTVDGHPVVVNKFKDIPPGQEGEWVMIEHPVMKRVFAFRTKDRKTKKGKIIPGKLTLGEGQAWVHPSIARPLLTILEKPFTNFAMRVVETINAAGKSLNVFFSFFHGATLFGSSSAVNARFLNPLRGVLIGPFEQKRLGVDPPLGVLPRLNPQVGLILGEKDQFGMLDAIAHGLVVDRTASTDYARGFLEKQARKVTDVTKSVPVLNFMTALLEKGIVGFNTILWDNIHTGLKLFAYHTIVNEEIMNAKEDADPAHIKRVIATQLNNAFGGQEFIDLPNLRWGEMSFAEPATKKQVQFLHAVVFAPDWTWSNIKVFASPVAEAVNFILPNRKFDPLNFKLGVRYWRNMVLSYAGLVSAIQLGIWAAFRDDDPDLEQNPWDNEKGAKWDIDVTPIRRAIQQTLGIRVTGQRYYVGPGKQFKEVIRYFEDFPEGAVKTIGNKSSVLVRGTFEQFGHTINGFPMPWTETPYRAGLLSWENLFRRGLAAGENFLPFAWQANNFAFTLPQKKGMTQFKGMQYYKQAFNLYTHPDLYAKMTGQPDSKRSETLLEVIREVDDALKKNGFNRSQRARVYSSAKSTELSANYRDFWTAYEAQKFKKADDAAGRLFMLDVTEEGALRSAELRGIDPDIARQGAAVFEAGKVPTEFRDRTLTYDDIFPFTAEEAAQQLREAQDRLRQLQQQ